VPDNHNAILPMFSPMAETPKKRYYTIVADPPWRYDTKPAEGGTTYPTMTQSELLCLPIGNWAADNAHLYLWTTNSFLVEAHELVKAWGFEYKTLITWVKRKPVNDNWIGMGFYFRGVTEHVLFAVRGALSIKEKDQANLFYAPRSGHSEKPQTFYDIVERMSHGPYLDVFARKQRMGWDTFGNEAFNFGTELPPEAFTVPA
jgi:N6-adenosine-specific RNA methylase IME4